MRNKLGYILAMIMATTELAAESLRINVFGVEWVLPVPCELQARHSVLDSKIYLSCDLDAENLDKFDVVSIRIVKFESELSQRIHGWSLPETVIESEENGLSIISFRPKFELIPNNGCSEGLSCIMLDTTAPYSRYVCDKEICVSIQARRSENLEWFYDSLRNSHNNTLNTDASSAGAG